MVEKQQHRERHEPASDGLGFPARHDPARPRRPRPRSPWDHVAHREHGQGRAASALLPPGPELRTADGERNVEDIAVGDLLLTASGQFRPVQWVGRWQALRKAGERWSADVRPVRIRQSALGPDNALHGSVCVAGPRHVVDGVLVPAGQLVNGASITLHDAKEADELEYFHVKMASHDVIWAAGAPSDTLLNYPDAARELDVQERSALRAEFLVGRVSGARSQPVRAAWLRHGWARSGLDVIRSRLQQQATVIGC